MPRYKYAQPFDIVRSVKGLQNDVRNILVRLPGLQDPWHYVGDATTGLGTSFGTGWANRGAPWANLAFRKIASSRIEIVGGITVGTAGTTVFTLPTGYRPISQQSINYFVVAGNTGNITNEPLLNVASTGVVSQNGISTPSATAAWVHDTFSLDV